jgi:carbon-monoxide dehydrogenase medium subunit
MTEYLFPTSIEEAIQFLEAHPGKARIVAGGTDLMADIRKGEINPRYLVDVTRVPGLDRIAVSDDFVEVGAAVTFAAIKDSPFLKAHVGALTGAARSVGAVGIQNAATWAGNIVQAMPAADGAVVAVALEAEAQIVDRHGAAWHPVESLFDGPGVSTVDPSRQLVARLRFPRPRLPWGTAWQRIGRRPSLVLPILNCAVTLGLSPDGRSIERATVALGPVAPRPFRARKAEAFLIGQQPMAGIFAQAARIVQGESNPRTSLMRASREYRLAIIPPSVSQALAVAAERAKESVGK